MKTAHQRKGQVLSMADHLRKLGRQKHDPGAGTMGEEVRGVADVLRHSRDSVAVQRVLRKVPRGITANRVTALRCILVAPMVAAIAVRWYWTAFILFAFGAFLDWLDGPLARAQDDETPEGEFLDQLGDKFATYGAMFALLMTGALSQALRYATWAGLSIAVLLVGVRFYKKATGHASIGSSSSGKVKVVAETAAVLMLLLHQAQGSTRFLVFAATYAAATGFVSGVLSISDRFSAWGPWWPRITAFSFVLMASAAAAHYRVLHLPASVLLAAAVVLSVLSLRDQIRSMRV